MAFCDGGMAENYIYTGNAFLAARENSVTFPDVCACFYVALQI